LPGVAADLILGGRAGEGEGEITESAICLAIAAQRAQPLPWGTSTGDAVFGLKGQKLYDLKGSNIYKLNGDLVGHLSDARGKEKRLDKTTDKLFPEG
jgi:hypothetical protein